MRLQTWEAYKRLLVDGFVAINFAFLSIDIWLAHSINRFRHPAEWVPLWFSIGAALVVGGALLAELRGRRRVTSIAGAAVGVAAIALGIAGLVLHLESQFFARFTIASLVYTAPFAAPLAYTGLGFLLLANRMLPPGNDEWGRWIVFLALGGFFGNFVLSLADHAQNGFFYASEWVPVASSAFAVGFLLMAVLDASRALLAGCFAVLALQAAVGLAGFGYHLSSSINGVSSSLYENFIHGAPLLAPLLFVNLALLAALGVWDRWQQRHSGVGQLRRASTI